MEFRLLGAVAVVTEGGDLPLGPAKRSAVLATLLLHPNAAVRVDRLIEALWAGEPPQHARTVLQGHVSRLRALLAEHGAEAYGVELVTQGAAYTLRLPESLLDSHRFEELLGLAREQVRRGRPADAVLMLREALALWQGPALTGTVASPPLEGAARALEEQRLSAVEALSEAYGQLGEHARAAAVLRTEAVAHPLRESLAAGLMLALSRSGRRSDALDWYHRTRRLLADELGVDPGSTLTDAYTAILGAGEAVPLAAAEPGTRLAPPAGTGTSPGPDRRAGTAGGPALPGTGADDAGDRTVAAPRLLPRPPRGFTARGAELAALDRGRSAAAGDAPVLLVTGPAGVGKTALAVHWAHARRADHPDGQLFADLRGFSDTPDRETHLVLREFLLALGVASRRLPETTEAMGALYRSLTADRTLLVVLDNARRSEQVRPLLPGGDHCVTVVTSRHRLSGLVASDAARPVPLGHLGAADSTALLAAVLGEERPAAEPDAALRLAGLCDGLPLALRVTAARLAGHAGLPLAAMADELADEQNRLGLLSAEDTGVSAALRLTVQQLPGPAGRMFRLLGLHTGPDLDRFAAAALAGTSPDLAAAALDRLAAAHLIAEPTPGRYAFHDLVRLYARGLTTGAARSGPAEPDALVRLLDHYIHTALAADAAAEPGSQPCCALPADARRPAAVREFEDRTAAMDWLEAERPALEGAVAAAVRLGLHDRAWRLVLLQWPLILCQVRDGWAPLLETALASAERVGDPDAQSRARALLGWVLHEEERLDEALAHLAEAPELAALAGDVVSEAIARINLAVVLDRTGESGRAGELFARGLELAEEAAHPSTQILALQHLARYHLAAGAYALALEYARRALEIGPSPAAVATRVGLLFRAGEALAGLGRREEAVEQLESAARVAEAEGYAAGVTASKELLASVTARR